MSKRFGIAIFYHLCFLMGCALINFVHATHNRAGEITYRHLSGHKYEITVTTYTRTQSYQADRCEIEINFGDGSSADTIKRTNGTQCPTTGGLEDGSCQNCGELYVNPEIKVNKYVVEHVFPGPGIYLISVDDPNRNADVVNVPNSVNTSFYIESELYISPFGGTNSSPILDFPPVDIACADILFEHNPGAHDPDGDSLFFSILANRGGSGSQITNYSFPNQVPGCGSSSLTINPNTGLLTWNAPVCCQFNPMPDDEEFNIAILIEEFRNGKKIGSVLRDMQINVDCDCDNAPPYIIAASQLCVYAGDTIDTAIVAIDPDGDNITLTASGEPLSLSPNPATLTPAAPMTGDSMLTTIFHWNTNCSNVRNNLYNTTFRVEDDDPVIPLVDYHTLGIKVIAPRVENPQANPSGNNMVLTWDPAFCASNGYSVYRRIDSAGFSVGSCQTGLPQGTGYINIAACNVNGNSFTDDNNGAGLVHGQKYCYVVIACLDGGYESVVSEEFCGELKNDVPIITNVSVFITDPSNGGDSVIWSMPKELDTNQYKGPYKYRIYRTEGFGNAATLIDSTDTSSVLAFTDTFFVDMVSSLNTQFSPYTYKIELISETASVGFTTSASSVFLSSSGTDNMLQLSWQEQVPWANSKYFVYRKNTSGTFDFLSEVASNSFTDTGLVNGAQYCYYVQSLGSYSSPGVIDTILNNSQIHCNSPYDNVPPCEPDTLTIQGDCNLFANTLTWNNPNFDCADDVTGYNIYYTPLFGGELSLIARITSAADTGYLNDNLVSIAGCYAVSALDSNNNESPLSDTTCIDNCPEYSLPNIFTPGTDGYNDLFRPLPYKFVAKINMQIFNRWGQMVFETTDPDIMWDGKLLKTKKMCPAGVYYYVCQVHEIRLTGLETVVLSGYIHMIPENGGVPQPSN